MNIGDFCAIDRASESAEGIKRKIEWHVALSTEGNDAGFYGQRTHTRTLSLNISLIW